MLIDSRAMPDPTYHLNGAFKPTMKRSADLSGPDFFPTPRWATFALIENEPFDGEIWDPACGDGAMASVLATTGNTIMASDLYDRGFGQRGSDFLEATRETANIVTNPPYNCAEAFVAQANNLATRKFALLLRLAFLEGVRRADTIFAVAPPARIWAFSERITFYPKGAKRAGAGTTAYAWFVWDKARDRASTELCWLKPGYKARFGA